ncbi:MAG: sulfite exporter TauE/SafE family protein [bacterium]
MNLWLIFLTGLTSGGVTCAAMQGGLLAGVIVNQKKDKTHLGFGVDDYGPVAAFLATKWIGHIILGLFLGWVGSTLTLSLGFRIFFQGFAALFMFVSAMNLLDVHPIFRYFVITPPQFARKLIKNQIVASSLFAPALLGLFTVLIPCGVTQAMEVLAVSSLSPTQGALIMGSFVLGTAPMFVVIGLATAKLSEDWRTNFLRLAAILLIGMSLYSFNGILRVSDSAYSLERLGPHIVKLLPPYEKVSKSQVQATDPNVKLVNGVQKITLSITSHGYSPKNFRVQNNIPVELTLVTKGDVYSCATDFTFKAFNISDLLKPTDSKVHTFTPTKKGIYTFACSMGMYSGTMEVL